MTTEHLNHRTTDDMAPVTAPPHPTASPLLTPPPGVAPVPRRPSSFRAQAGFRPGGRNTGDHHTQEIDGWHRKMSATIAHLRHAYALIDKAESMITLQGARIAFLEDLATTDDMTGLKNRRGFAEDFERELEHCKRGLSKGGLLVMIDLDTFKSINDTYGHQAGDAVLRLVGKALNGEIRKTDTAARLGGDEFVILFCNISRADAAVRAQNIVRNLNNLSLAWYGDIIPVRASVGLKSFAAGDRADAVMRAADGALYSHKSDRKKNPAHLSS